MQVIVRSGVCLDSLSEWEQTEPLGEGTCPRGCAVWLVIMSGECGVRKSHALHQSHQHKDALENMSGERTGSWGKMRTNMTKVAVVR